MVRAGFYNALSEATLILFTTLAPSGTLAVILIAFALIANKMEYETRVRLNHALIIPLGLTMIGLVASATHLGNPENALYVFTQVGNSPLSNEVLAAVIFLIFSGIYWLYTFSEKPHILVQNIWLLIIVITGFIFIGTIGLAYAAPTILSWNTVYVPINIWLNAFIGGPILALLTFHISDRTLINKKFGLILCGTSLCVSIANTMVMVLQYIDLATVSNSYGKAIEYIPFYWIVIIVFLVACIVVNASLIKVYVNNKVPTFNLLLIATIVILLAILLTRVMFYMMRMTVGPVL